MENFKTRLFNYEVPPPEKTWSNIAADLDNEKVIKIPGLRKKSKLLFYSLTAAASLIIIFVGTFFFNKNTGIKSIANNTVLKINNPISQKTKDSITRNYQILEAIINAPQDKKLLASNFEKEDGVPKKYITIAGPEGQPVKISPKAATLILSADNEYPPRPVWNKKIEKWKQIMMNKMTSPTSTNLVDILQLASIN
ncbi:MAG: hypothetical protein Q8891_04095 [Bacteroidota bacterium]|nr:hypothetical protein [Bacteroidota bacterium]